MIKIDVSVRTSDKLEGFTKYGLANPTIITPKIIMLNNIKSLFFRKFFIDYSPLASPTISSDEVFETSKIFFIKPLYITTTLSHIPKISGSSDEIIIIDIPESTNSPINSCTADLDLTSIPFVGSSKIIISGFVESHFAITVFC